MTKVYEVWQMAYETRLGLLMAASFALKRHNEDLGNLTGRKSRRRDSYRGNKRWALTHVAENVSPTAPRALATTVDPHVFFTARAAARVAVAAPAVRSRPQATRQGQPRSQGWRKR
jgi:hypothetical protein